MKTRATHTDTNGSTFTVTTNNRWRWPLCWSELSKSEREAFDYLTTEDQMNDAEFIRSRGRVFHTAEVLRCAVPGWDGVYNDTMFSAVLFKVNDDGEWMTGRLYA
ncbi:MAG: hypothetical protein RL260_1711 [Pseudomonadota bacterium]|jgi:hypothetical protein